MRLIILTVAAFLCSWTSRGFADTLTFVSGGELSCIVIREGKQDILVLMDNALVAVSSSTVRKVQRDPAPNAEPLSRPRIMPATVDCLRKAADTTWSDKLQQIPAFVIDRGIMRNVPYKSYRSGDWEINVYGDPDNPSGFEIGLYGQTSRNADARKKCREYIASLLTDVADQKAVADLNDEGGEVLRDKWTFEVTPSTSEDAYGAWWISVYEKGALDRVRATDKELQEISDPIKKSEKAAPAKEQKPTMPPRRTDNPSAPSRSTPAIEVPEGWSSKEYESARKPASTGGRVYVRGYTRKDGTYVRPHTRRR